VTDDRTVIAERVQDWVVFRDSGFWERLRGIWGPDGLMTTTWFRGTADEFVAHNRHAWGPPVPGAVHMLGGISVDVAGARAVSQTKMTISVRGSVHDTPCEVTCFGRFYDRWYKNAGAWLLAERAVIYERDRLDVLDGALYPKLDATILAAFPPGYQHLAYVQQAMGINVNKGLPGLTGPAVDALYEKGRLWLVG
jgi:hypothetical protein